MGDGFAPFDNNNIIGVVEIFLEIFNHNAGIRKTVKIVVYEIFIIRQSIGFRNSKTRASDWCFDAETFSEAPNECGFASTNITD